MHILSLLKCGAALVCACLLLCGPSRAGEPTAPEVEDLEALLNHPVYSASKFAQGAADAPAAVTVLTAGDIRSHGWRTLAEILNSVRGIYLRNDRNYTYIGVRGVGRAGDFSTRLLVMIDGMRVNDNIYGQGGAGREFPLDVGLIERVEFIAGPGSALYGSNALLGVVNVITRSAVSLRGSVASVQVGTDSARAIRLTQGLEFDNSQLVLAARSETRPGRDHRFPEFDAPDTAGGWSRDADRERDRKLYAKWTAGPITATALISERSKQLPTGAFDTVFPSTDTRTLDRYAFADVQWQHALAGDEQVFVRATLAQYNFGGRFDYGPVDGLQHLDQQGRWLGVEARWLYDGWQRQRVVVGVEAQENFQQNQHSHYTGDASDSASIHGSSRRFGLFATDEISVLPGLRAVLGARVDRQLDDRVTATPRLALLWDPAPGWVLKLLDGRAYREPNDFESRFQDNTLLANSNLRNEKLHSTELAVDWRAWSNLRLSASAYRNRIDNLIEQQTDEATGQLVFRNVGKVKVEGVEMEADYVHAAGWRLRGNAALQNARDVRARQRMSNSPRVLGKLNLSAPLPVWQARAGLEWQHVGPRRTLAGDRLPSHGVANATFTLSPLGSPVALSASLYNLFDKRYADPGGPDLLQDRLAQDRRQWRVEASIQF